VDEPEAVALKDLPDAARDVEEHERQRLLLWRWEGAGEPRSGSRLPPPSGLRAGPHCPPAVAKLVKAIKVTVKGKEVIVEATFPEADIASLPLLFML